MIKNPIPTLSMRMIIEHFSRVIKIGLLSAILVSVSSCAGDVGPTGPEGPQGVQGNVGEQGEPGPVSYTHLTLPTILLV